MQGGIAQTIGLVLSANARKRGLQTTNWPDGSIYTFCNRVTFLGRKRDEPLGFGRVLEVDNPDHWLETLPAQMTKAQLCALSRSDPNISDRESVGFANGGPIFLAQIVAPNLESWQGNWEVTDKDRDDQRIWSVTYRNVANIADPPPSYPLSEVRDALTEALEEAAKFSSAHNMGFTASFTAAQKALSDRTPLEGFYHADMVPDGLLALEHLQIFASAAKAWVFGGMGSWNDIWFEGADQLIYQELSDRLFSAIVNGLVQATNASAESL
jgi:hypothetical protein